MASQDLVVVLPKQSLDYSLMAAPFEQNYLSLQVADMQYQPPTLASECTEADVKTYFKALVTNRPDPIRSHMFFTQLKQDGFLAHYYGLNFAGSIGDNIRFKFTQANGTASGFFETPIGNFHTLFRQPGPILSLTEECIEYALWAVTHFIFRQQLGTLFDAIWGVYAAQLNANRRMFEFVKPEAFFQAAWDATVDALRDVFIAGGATSVQIITDLTRKNLEIQIINLKCKHCGPRVLQQGQEVISSFVSTCAYMEYEIKAKTVQFVSLKQDKEELERIAREQAAQIEHMSCLFGASLSFQQQSNWTNFAAAAVATPGAQMALAGPPAPLPIQAPLMVAADASSRLPVQASGVDDRAAALKNVKGAFMLLGLEERRRFNNSKYHFKVQILGTKRTKLGHSKAGEIMAQGVASMRYLKDLGHDVDALRFIKKTKGFRK